MKINGGYMNKKRKIYILGSALAVVLVIIIAFYFFHQIRLGVQDDNLSNLSAFGTQLDAHFNEMNDKYFSLLENCLATVHSSSYDSREDILDYFKDRHDIWNYRTAGVMDKKGEYVTIDGDTGRLKDLSFTEENAGYIDNDSMSIVNFGIGDELLYYVELKEGMDAASEIAGIFITPAFDELEYLLALNVYTEEGYATVINREGDILLKPHYEYNMMVTDNFLDSLALSDQGGVKPNIQLEQDMAARESGSLIFSRMGRRSYLVYMPVGNSSWYLLVTVPAHVLETTARSFRNFIIAAILVTIVLLLFFCTIHFTGRQHIIDEKNREILSKEQISKQRLETALEEAKRANQAKSVFLSNMSHDIRTPMNAIIGMTRIALSHIDKKEKVRDCLEKISASSAHLLSLINDVLDMSRIESGRLTLNSEQFNLKDLMDTLIGIIQPQISSGHFDFTVDMEDVEHLDLIGDPLRFKQLFLNIVGNSVKFTDPGGRIAVKVQELPSPSEDPVRLRFIFSDTGIGMSPEFLKRMFQPFERSDVPRASQMEGTGLGMAITKNITELMKGSIRAESKEGEGTTFYIELPFQKGAPQPYHPDPFKELSLPQSAASDSGHTGKDTDYSNRHLLLVEDNELNLEIAKELISATNVQIDTAVNGQEALDKVSSSAPGYYNLVLMDIRMPIMDGYEACRRIRRINRPDLQDLPVIAMTADAFAEDRQQALDAGMNGHISKPIDLRELYNILEKYLA